MIRFRQTNTVSMIHIFKNFLLQFNFYQQSSEMKLPKKYFFSYFILFEMCELWFEPLAHVLQVSALQARLLD